MVFPHLSFSNTSLHLLSSFVNHLHSPMLTHSAGADQSEKKAPLFSYFMPCFLEEDQILQDLCQAGICDEFVIPRDQFNFVDMPSFSINSSVAQKTVHTMISFLNDLKQMDSEVFGEGKNQQRLNIRFIFCDMLRYLISKSQEPVLMTNQDGINIYSPASPIQDIKLIGSAALKPLKEILTHTIKQFFGSVIPLERIEKWSQMKHVDHPFNKEMNDTDLRILSPANLQQQAYLSNKTSSYLANSIQNFNADFYINQLKIKSTKYKSLTHQNQPKLKIQEFALLEFGGITKRKIVKLEKTKYAILGLKTLSVNSAFRNKPTDLLFVSLNDQGEPDLEHSNSSSLNCWTISLYPLLVHNSLNKCLIIETKPFTAAKALIDWLCGISTMIPTVEAWIRSILNCERSMQIDIEETQLGKIFEFKEEFIRQHKILKWTLLAQTKISNGEYLYYLLEKQIQQLHDNAQTKSIPLYSVIPFLFRACLSLQKSSSFSDADCATLWSLADAKGWLQTEKSPHLEAQTASALKQALINEKTPFSLVAAWMGILAWGWAPSSATSHCQKPVFLLKQPVLCLLSIQPVKHSQILQQYLSQHPCPAAFSILYQVMASSYQPSVLHFCLTPHLNKLEINPLDLKKCAEEWLLHSSSLLNIIGLQLYLEISSLFPLQPPLVFIFQSLPKFLRYSTSLQQSQELLKALKAWASSASPGYQEALERLDLPKNGPVKRLDWLSILAQTKDTETLRLAYHLWREYKSDSAQNIERHLEIGHTLYHSLCVCQPRGALSILKIFHERHLLKSIQLKDSMVSLIQAYQTYAPQQFVCDIDQILPLMASLFEQENPPKFHIEKEQQAFSQAAIYLIETLYQIPSQQIKADDFLLQFCRKNLILDHAWQTRTWLNRMEELVSDPKQAIFAYSLYHILCEENLWDQDSEKSYAQQLHITLGEALLTCKQASQSLRLFHQLSQEEKNSSSTSSFYNWVLHLFQQQAQHPLEAFDPELFHTLLRATSLTKQGESQHEFYLFFQRLVTSLKSTPYDLKFSEKFSLTFFDQFLLNENFPPLMKQSVEKWRGLLLDYLETSSSFTPTQRFPHLWLMYEKILRFKGLKPSDQQVLQLLKLFSLLLEHVSTPLHAPTSKLIKWMQTEHKNILDTFYKNDCAQEAKTFLFALDCNTISPENLTYYVWWLCQKDLKTSQPSSILHLLDLVDFENLKAEISLADYPLVSPLIENILEASPSRPVQAWNWLEWCLQQTEKEQIVEHALLMDYCLTCATQFLASQNYTQALHVLKNLSHLSPLQKENASLQWKQIVSQLSSSPVEVTRRLFLDSSLLAFGPELKIQLIPFVPTVIQRHLSASSSENVEKILALDLLTNYSLKEAAIWLVLWKSLEINGDDACISQIWEGFEKQKSMLTGTKVDIANCWTLAFVCLQKINHDKLLDYFYDHKWLSLFDHPSTVDLKWKALEAVFLGAVNALSPTTFNEVLFKLILDLKVKISLSSIFNHQQNISAQFLQEIQNKNVELFIRNILGPHEETNFSHEKNLANQWNRTIEGALNERLHSSSDFNCLWALTTLLYSPLKNYADSINDQNLYDAYLKQFEKIVSSYVTLDVSAIPENSSYSALANLIHQLINILCNPDVQCNDSYFSIMESLLKKPTEPHLKLAFQLLSKIFRQKEIKNIERLKKSFLILTPLIVATPLAPQLISIENYLERSFIHMKLSLIEKSDLSYCFLKASYHYRFSTHELKDQCIVDMLALYLKWGPYLFVQPRYLKEILEKICPLLVPYASKIRNNWRDQDLFTLCLSKLFDVLYQVNLPSAPVYQDNIKNYLDELIHILKALDIESIFLINAFHSYTDKKIEQVTFNQLEPTKKALHLLDKFVRLYPPQPPTWRKEHKPNNVIIRKLHPSLHLAYSQQLLIKANSKGLFKHFSHLLTPLELWTDCIVSGVSRHINGNRLIFDQTIKDFLACKTPYSITRAIQNCHYLQIKLTPPQDLKTLIPLYQAILKGIQPHVKEIIQHDESSFNPLLEYLDSQTRALLPTDTVKARQHACEVLTLYFRFTLETVKTLINDREDTPFQTYYLHKCFELLRAQTIYGAFATNTSSYFSILRELLFLVKKVTVKYAYYPSEKTALFIDKPKHLFQEWTEALLYAPFMTKNHTILVLKVHEKKEQLDLLLDCLNRLKSKDEDDNTYELYENLLTVFFTLASPYQSKSSYWMTMQTEEANSLFESIKQFFNSSEPNSRQKLTFEFINLLFIEKNEQNYLAYIEKVSGIIQQIPHITLFQTNDHPFTLFSHGILTILFATPPALKNQENPYMSQRKQLFLDFLIAMQPHFNKASPAFLLEAQKLLMETLEGGIDRGLFEFNDATAKQMEWARQWFEKDSADIEFDYITRLCLLGLIFHRKSRYETNASQFQTDVRKLRQPLCEYILKTKDFSASKRFVCLIEEMPTSPTEKFLLFLEWINAFPEFIKAEIVSQEDQKAICDHIRQLGLEAKKQNIFNEVRFILEKKFDGSKPGQLVTYAFIKEVLLEMISKTECTL